MLAICCPGQGSQTPGFLTPWLERPEAKEFLDLASEATGLDLIRLGTVADADEIKDTSVTQPLIVAASLLAARLLIADRGPFDPGTVVLAGHSVGEYAVAALAGILTDTEALSLVAARGRAMAAASAISPTGMSACLGGDEAEVLAALGELGLSPANRNGAGQIVAAGPLTALAALAENPPPRTRVRPLAVAGAFHTAFMESARVELAALAGSITPADPTLPILSNRDGVMVTSGADYLDRLVTQVASPVRWDLCMQSLQDAEAEALVELPPAGALVGLAKRAMQVPTLAVKTPQDLPQATRLLADSITPLAASKAH